MGEGEGAKDVSDKIENEDQLLGAQQKGEEEHQVRMLATVTQLLACLNISMLGVVHSAAF